LSYRRGEGTENNYPQYTCVPSHHSFPIPTCEKNGISAQRSQESDVAV
jgi:hypothetical protein